MRSLRVVTWNILHEVPGEDERDHPWRDRRAAARRLLGDLRPDVFCTQEAYPGQMDALLRDLPHHWSVGLDRDGGHDGEGCPVAFDTRRFRRLDWGQFWLGPLPDTPAALTWINDVPRIVTWVRLEDRASGARFRVANAHLDHLVPASRTKTVKLLQERLGDADAEEPTILVGDFNSPAWAKPHRMLVRRSPRFHDALRLAETKQPRYAGTYHHFKGRAFLRVDWVLTRPALRVKRYTVVRDAPGGVLPSDHFPVCVDLPLPFEAPRARALRRARGTAS